MNNEQLEEIILKNGFSAFRVKQAKKSVFARLIADWDEASDLPADLRGLLKDKIAISEIAPIAREESAKRDAIKTLFKTHDGFFIEAVLMKHDRSRHTTTAPFSAFAGGRRTVCVSSQVGCAMNCSFCATGKLGFQRNLTAGEITDQVLYFARWLKDKKEAVTNVVYMGMGEPFNNYDNVMESVRILNDKDGLNLGARHISISTCGVAAGIKKFADEKSQINPVRNSHETLSRMFAKTKPHLSSNQAEGRSVSNGVNLAISLHAPTDEIRSKIMPVNLAYPLKKLMPAIADYVEKTRRKVMFEYILLGGVNDSDKCARELAGLMKGNKLYHINLIKYHQTFAKGESMPTFRASSQEQMRRFFDILKKSGVSCTFRVSFGEDISGACGQLAGK